MLPQRSQVHPNKNGLLLKVLRILLHLIESINFKFVRYMSNIRSEIRRRLINQFWRFKQIQSKSSSWRNKGNRKKHFVGCYTSWLKDGIYTMTNVGVYPNLMYIQCISKFLFSWKQLFFKREFKRSSLIIKKPTNKPRQVFWITTNKLTKDLVIIASSLWIRY